MSKLKTYEVIVVVQDSYEGLVQASKPRKAKHVAEALFNEGGYLAQFDQDILRIDVKEVQP